MVILDLVKVPDFQAGCHEIAFVGLVVTVRALTFHGNTTYRNSTELGRRYPLADYITKEHD